MEVLVNKSQEFDKYDLVYAKELYKHHISVTMSNNHNNFIKEDIDIDTLLEYINKGYGIKINCK